MTDLKLTKKLKEGKPINLDKLLIAKLFIVEDQPYYINGKKSGSMISSCRTDNNGKVRFFTNPKTLNKIEGKTIIIKKPKLMIDVFWCPKYVEECLTGVKLQFAHVIDTIKFECDPSNRYALDTNHKKLDMFVCLDNEPRNPTMEEVEEYMKEHQSIATYEFLLETEKDSCRRKHIEDKPKQKIKK